MLRSQSKSILIVIALFSFSGCALEQAPLMYSSKTSIGINIGSSVEENGAHIDIGFKNHDMVYIPVAVSKKDSNSSNSDNNQTITKITATSSNNTNDTLSIFATFAEDFSKDSNKSKATTFGIEKFVSTGVAAQNLSKSFALKQCYDLITNDFNSTQIVETIKLCNGWIKKGEN